MAWEQGRAVIEKLLDKGALMYGDTSIAHAYALLDEARRHVESTSAVTPRDPRGGYALVYAAASKTLAAVLAAQGLYATGRGDDLTVYDAVHAQLEPPFGAVLSPFLRVRAQRVELECGAPNSLAMTPRDVFGELVKVESIVFLVERLVPQLDPFGRLRSMNG